MIRKFTFLSLLALLGLAAADIASNSAPPSSSGAPGEVNCTTSGCHDDNALNSGGGTSSLSMGNNITQYVPGTTYTLTVNINQGSLGRFGFQLMAMKDADSSNAGLLKVTDASRTQIISGLGNKTNRKYMTYTYAGTNAVSQGNGQWTFEWEAPSSDIGPVTLYLATIAANNDGTDLGDYCYLKSLNLTAAPVGIKQEASSDKGLKIYPNPVKDNIGIEYSLETAGVVTFELCDLKGTSVQVWNTEMKAVGDHKQNLSLSSRYPQGIYLLKLSLNGTTTVKNLYID